MRYSRRWWVATVVALVAVGLATVVVPAWWQRVTIVAVSAGTLWLLPGLPLTQDRLPTWLGRALLIWLVVVFSVTRLMPLTQSAAPLGYDAGLYRQALHYYADAQFALPDAPPFSFVSDQFIGLYGVTAFLQMLGLSADVVLYGFGFLVQALIISLIYRWVRETAGPLAGLIVLTCIIASPIFFVFYWFVLLKNALAILCLVLALLLWRRKSVFVILPIAGVLLTHTATTVLLLLMGVGMLILQPSWRRFGMRLAVPVVVFTLVAALVNLSKLKNILRLIEVESVTSTSAVSAGIFVPFDVTIIAYLFLLPFVALVLRQAVVKRDVDTPVIGLVTSSAYAASPLLFHVRFTAYVDLFVMILGGLGVASVAYVLWHTQPRLRAVACAMFVVGASAIGGWFALQSQPIYATRYVRALEDTVLASTKPTHVITTDSLYGPLVAGWTRGTIAGAPGMLEDTTWRRNDWFEFWQGDTTRQLTLIQKYRGKRLYIFVPERRTYGIERIPGGERINTYLYRFEP